MAELHLYKCKKCGWEIETPSEGADMLMDSIMACYVCHDCQHVFKKYYALGTVFNGKVSCPQCKGYNTQDWEPNDGCPKCGGDLENQSPLELYYDIFGEEEKIYDDYIRKYFSSPSIVEEPESVV